MKNKKIIAVALLVLITASIIFYRVSRGGFGPINSSIVTSVPVNESNISDAKNVSMPVYHSIFKFITGYLPFKERTN